MMRLKPLRKVTRGTLTVKEIQEGREGNEYYTIKVYMCYLLWENYVMALVVRGGCIKSDRYLGVK